MTEIFRNLWNIGPMTGRAPPANIFRSRGPVYGSDHYLVHYGRINGRAAIVRFWADERYQQSGYCDRMQPNESVLIVI